MNGDIQIIIILAILAIGCCLTIIGLVTDHEFSFFMGLFALGIALVSCIALDTNTIKEAKKLCEDKGYDAFVNGQEVNIENVDIDRYHITIDHEKQKVMLTTK